MWFSNCLHGCGIYLLLLRRTMANAERFHVSGWAKEIADAANTFNGKQSESNRRSGNSYIHCLHFTQMKWHNWMRCTIVVPLLVFPYARGAEMTSHSQCKSHTCTAMLIKSVTSECEAVQNYSIIIYLPWRWDRQHISVCRFSPVATSLSVLSLKFTFHEWRFFSIFLRLLLHL